MIESRMDRFFRWYVIGWREQLDMLQSVWEQFERFIPADFQ